MIAERSHCRSAATTGVLAPAAVIVGAYWATGGLTALYEACIAFQAVYTEQLRGQEAVWAYWFQKLTRLGANAALLPVAYVPFLFFGKLDANG